MTDAGWTPPNKNNEFRKGDIVRFRAGIGLDHIQKFEVDHVETSRVFIKSYTASGREKLLDRSWTDFDLHERP